MGETETRFPNGRKSLWNGLSRIEAEALGFGSKLYENAATLTGLAGSGPKGKGKAASGLFSAYLKIPTGSKFKASGGQAGRTAHQVRRSWMAVG
jgi:hypothetical protein